MTNFFEYQNQVRKKSKLVLIIFFLMLIALLFIYNFFIFHGVRLFYRLDATHQNLWLLPLPYLKTQLLFLGLFVSTFIITFYILFLSFKNEPLKIAYELDARALNDIKLKLSPDEKQLLNIVEEMSIAAGLPVIPTYLLSYEESINSFTAGPNIQTAYIAVTNGALKNLNRDELQAVVAHEIGHIVSGDVNLNSLLLTCITSLTFLVTIGRKILEHLKPPRFGSRSGTHGILILSLLGLIFIILGTAGAFLGRLLQSLFSRKREYLSDSLSVQFTRNPAALASALTKIKDTYGSTIRKATSINIAHMCIANPVSRNYIGTLFNSHPSLESRLKLLGQNDMVLKQGTFPTPTEIPKPSINHNALQKGLLVAEPILSSAIAKKEINTLEQFMVHNNQDSQEQLNFAYGLWSLLLSKIETTRQQQIEILKQLYGARFDSQKIINTSIDQNTKFEIEGVAFKVIIPYFRSLELNEKTLFIKSLKLLIHSDSEFTNFEKIILASFLVSAQDKKDKYKLSLKDLKIILETFSNSNQSQNINFENLVTIINAIKNSSLKLKQKVCSSILTTLKNSDSLNQHNIEAFRAFSISIGIPSPPILL